MQKRRERKYEKVGGDIKGEEKEVERQREKKERRKGKK